MRGGAKRGPTYDGDCTLCMIYVAAPGDTFYSALFANVVTETHFRVMAGVVSGNISLMFLFHSLVEVLCGDDELRQHKTRHKVGLINRIKGISDDTNFTVFRMIAFCEVLSFCLSVNISFEFILDHLRLF